MTHRDWLWAVAAISVMLLPGCRRDTTEGRAALPLPKGPERTHELRAARRDSAPGADPLASRSREPLSSLLKKGTGSEHTHLKPKENARREVPVPLFQQAVSPDGGVDPNGFSDEAQLGAVMATVRIVDRENAYEGSGVVVGTRDGLVYVLTAAHVVDHVDTAEVQVYSAATYPRPAHTFRSPRIVVRSGARDLAVLRFDYSQQLPQRLPICPRSQIPHTIDFPVMTVGCSNGKPPTPRFDRVVTTHLVRRSETAEPIRMWELAGKPIPGRSGGPMIDQNGLLLGISSGGSAHREFYCHIEEIHGFLEECGFAWLTGAENDGARIDDK